MTAFSFPAWYARMGYQRHGGQRDCAADLGLTDRHVRHLLNNGRPSQTVVNYCQFMQLTFERLRQIEEKLGIVEKA